MILARDNKTLSDLARAHVGRAAIVFGGAPSLPADVASLSSWSRYPSAIKLSANDHAFKLGDQKPERIDYIVACDDRALEIVKPLGASIIGPRHWAHFRVLHQTVSNSAALACIAAWAMGCAPIIVTGCELYSGDTYFHDRKAKSSGKSATLQQHLQRWAKLTECAPDAMFRVVSGPLLTLFKRFDPSEPAMPSPSLAAVLALVRGVKVEIMQDVPNWHGASYARGQVVETRRSEASILIAQRIARHYAELMA